tara:strand:- start:814 stop:1368 length:555 start_codon:yes stop_codon:yes gene_type:complete
MHKKVLSEIDTYFGIVDMPKYFEINREELKSNLLSSVIKDKYFSNSFVMSNKFDYEMLNGKAFTMLNTYLIEYFELKYGITISNDFNFGSIFNEKESSITKNLVNEHNLSSSSDYTCIYGIEVERYSQQLIIEYPNKRLKENFLPIELKNNEYIIFPSTLKYFFTQNNSNQINNFLTIAYNIVR